MNKKQQEFLIKQKNKNKLLPLQQFIKKYQGKVQ